MKSLVCLILLLAVAQASKIYTCNVESDEKSLLIYNEYSNEYLICQTYEPKWLDDFNKVVQDIHFDG